MMRSDGYSGASAGGDAIEKLAQWMIAFGFVCGGKKTVLEIVATNETRIRARPEPSSMFTDSLWGVSLGGMLDEF